jgi:hypothetical protein
MVDKRHMGRPYISSMSLSSTLIRFWIAQSGRDRGSIYFAAFNPWWRRCGDPAIDVSVEEAMTCSMWLQWVSIWFRAPLPQTGKGRLFPNIARYVATEQGTRHITMLPL